MSLMRHDSGISDTDGDDHVRSSSPVPVECVKSLRPDGAIGGRFDSKLAERERRLALDTTESEDDTVGRVDTRSVRSSVKKRKIGEVTSCEDGGGGGGGSVAKARALASTVSRVGTERFRELNTNKRLSDVLDDSVIELISGSVVQTGFGPLVIAVCVYTSAKTRKLEKGQLMFPIRCFNDVKAEDVVEKVITPRVLFFEGSKMTEGGTNSYYSVKVLSDNSVAPKRLAEMSREKSAEELRDMCKIGSFSDFPEGTVFVCTALRQMHTARGGDSKTGFRTSVITYESEADGVKRTGEIFLPNRLHAEVKRSIPAVIVYNGSKKSAGKCRTYFDISVVSSTVGEMLERELRTTS